MWKFISEKQIARKQKDLLPKALCAIWCLLLLVQCAKLEELPPISEDREEYPELAMRDTTRIDVYEGSLLSWVLRTTYLERRGKEKRLLVKPLWLTVYDSLGQESTWIESDSGSADEDVTFAHVWGNVHVHSEEGTKVLADSLVWEKKDRKVRTNGKVTVVSQKGDSITGIGFESDDKLENWILLSNVKTVVQDVQIEQDSLQKDSAQETVNSEKHP
jgi:LPS export ABC transporter protein LptC